MGHREELLVSALPLTLRIKPGAMGELRIVVKGFDPIDVRSAEAIVLRPAEHAKGIVAGGTLIHPVI
jgi:hypothetical protein